MTERIASNEARTTVMISRNFWALLLVLNVSPPPPNTGESPLPGACNKIEVTSSTEMII